MLLAASLLALLCLGFATAAEMALDPYRNRWFFTAKEIEIAYRYQHDFGQRLQRPLNAKRCTFGAKNFRAWLYGREQRLPCRFINQTLRHLSEILQAGAARYFFPLDLNHAHLAVPRTAWRERYRDLPNDEILPAMIHDPQLVALYHSAEHLRVPDPKARLAAPAVQAWQRKRNILGFYDGRPIKILPPHPDAAGLSVPKNYWGYGSFEFLAHFGAPLPVFVDDTVVAIDIRLDLGQDGLSGAVRNLSITREN